MNESQLRGMREMARIMQKPSKSKTKELITDLLSEISISVTDLATDPAYLDLLEATLVKINRVKYYVDTRL